MRLCLLAGLGVALGALLTACSAPRYPQAPMSPLYYRAADHTLHIAVCVGTRFRLVETAAEVTVQHTGAASDVGECPVDRYVLTLKAPLGTRKVVNGATGEAVPVLTWDAVAGAEFPAPSMSAG